MCASIINHLSTVCKPSGTLFDGILMVDRGSNNEVEGMMEVMVHIGRELRRWRFKRAMTQKQLADKAGLGINTIIRIESNNAEPRPPTIAKLARALEVDPAELVR